MLEKGSKYSTISRRGFLSRIGGLAGLAVSSSVLATSNSFAALNKSGFKWGYAAITWGGNDVQAIKDIASLGFKGIQLRSNTYKEYNQKVSELKDLLKQYKLQAPVFSSGNVSIDPAQEAATIKTHVDHAKFLKELGGKNLQVTTHGRPKDGAPSPEDLKRYAKLITEIGKQISDFGINLVYHNHMHQLGEKPEEIDLILQSSDEKYVKFLLDVAHYFQGGGNPVEAIKKYGSRISAVHMKDVKSPVDPANQDLRNNYKFVELGEGKIDLPGIVSALNAINYKGWAIVELDKVPEENRTPLQSGQISKKYISEQLKLTF